MELHGLWVTWRVLASLEAVRCFEGSRCWSLHWLRAVLELCQSCELLDYGWADFLLWNHTNFSGGFIFISNLPGVTLELL